jgi:hypothetical protein
MGFERVAQALWLALGRGSTPNKTVQRTGLKSVREAELMGGHIPGARVHADLRTLSPNSR